MSVYLEEVSKNEVEQAVSTHLGTNSFTIRNFAVKPASDNPLGFLGDHSRITIEIDLHGNQRTLHYFVKKVPTKAKAHYDYAQKTGAFYKEIELYKTLLQDLKNAVKPSRKTLRWLPEFYFARGNDLLIVEDLAVEGYYMYPERTELDLEHTQVIVDVVAVMHAASIIFEEHLKTGEAQTRSKKFSPAVENTIGSLYPNLIFETEASDEEGHPGNTFWEAGFRSQLSIIDLLPDFTAEQRTTIRQNLVEKLRLCLQFVKPSKKFRNVLLHGDLWANNFLYKRDSKGKVNEAILVDFQLARYGPPAHDLLMCLYLTNTREFRAQYESMLLDQYYRRVHKELEAENLNCDQLFPKSEFEESIQFYREYAILNNILYYQLILSPPQMSEKFLSSTDIWSKMMYEDRSELIATCYREDATCRSRIMEAMRELAEFYGWA